MEVVYGHVEHWELSEVFSSTAATAEREMGESRVTALVLPKAFYPLTWTEWRVVPGQSVTQGTLLGLYSRGSRRGELRAEGPGTVQDLFVSAGQSLSESW